MAKGKKSEIKPCVIQFIEITGFERSDGSLEAEEYANIVKDISAMYDDATKVYEGHVDKHEGKVFMATFGVPISHEEDPERAVKSTLLLKKKLKEYNKNNQTSLKIKAGINLGKVYAGDVGSDIKKEYTVMGDVVNIAARIMEQAGESQILVCEEIHTITEPMFQYGDAINIVPQGKMESIKVFEVLGQKSGFIKRHGIKGLESPLIGREKEMKLFKGFLKDLLNHKQNMIILLGEAGIGKSRIIEELFAYSLSNALEQARVVNWCNGKCSLHKEAIYQALIEIVKQICSIDSEDSDEIVTEKLKKQVRALAKEQAGDIYAYLANLLNIKLDARDEAKIKYLEPKELKLQTHVAIASLMKYYALQDPCVYVVDDLYLADFATLEALEFIIDTNKETPMLLILVSRPERERPFWEFIGELQKKQNLIEIFLERLNKTEIKKISEELLKIPKLPLPLINDMVTKSGGNPFFLEEIIKLLIAKGVLIKKGTEWLADAEEIAFSIPYTIEAIIRHRFDTLDASLRYTLEEMSIVGRKFAKKTLRAFSSQWENLDEIIATLSNNGFISTNNDEDFSFDHALVRDVIYSSIPSRRKTALHQKVAETIEVLFKDRLVEFYDVLFEHYVQTEKHDKTIDYGLKAAEKAQKGYANHEAILLYLAVLKELQQSSDNNNQRRKVMKELGEIHSLIGQNDDALEFFDQSLKTCKNAGEEADIYSSIAQTYANVSDYDRAIESYNTALNKIGLSSEIERARINVGQAKVYYEKGNYEEVIKKLEEALIIIGESTSIEAREIQAKIYDRFGSAYYSLGRRQESFNYYSKALKLYDMLDDINGKGAIYNNLCDYYTGQGDYPSAITYLQKSLEIDTKAGNLLGQAIVIYNFADTYLQLGDILLAEENYRKSLNLYDQINNITGIGYCNWGLGLICVEKNQYKEATAYFTKAMTILDEVGSKMWQIGVKLSIAELHYKKNEYAKAYKLCEEILAAAEEMKDYDTINSTKLTQVKVRIAQAEQDKKLAITYLQEAKDILTKLSTTISEQGASKETAFEVYAHMCRVSYMLGEPEKTIEYAKMAKANLDWILKFIDDKEAQERFLKRTPYEDFAKFCKLIKV
jgi:adenylate cyclase